MIHTVIVPGVGGSEHAHWQSWLQRQLMSCSRVQQQDWNQPILQDWISAFVNTVRPIQNEIQIVAHSFGCLTTVAALAQHPELNQKIKNLILVAPANPARFGEAGFSRDSQHAKCLAKAWQLNPINLGQVGHINVASGFGPFPEIYDYLISENVLQHINFTDDSKCFFKFAI